ncbi:MAG: outer membrane beta-barrel protein [Saprospiraceae bacterium]|nr:outer membrane beta-barrel protein [Saprospiraceae bacterium]
MNRIKIAILYLLCFTNSIWSQGTAPIILLKPIQIDSNWTKYSFQEILNTQEEIKFLRISDGLEYRQDSNSSYWIRHGNTLKTLFHIEIQKNNSLEFILFQKQNKDEFKNSIIDSDLKSDPCKFKIEKYTERKLYLIFDSIPDELYVLWNNTGIPFKRSGKHIIIYIPSFINEVEQSYIRLYSSKAAKVCKTIEIPLIFGIPSNIQESLTGIKYGGTHPMNSALDETKVFHTELPESPIELIDSILNPTITPIDKLKWFSAYIDLYYAFYTDSVGTNQYQKFSSISPTSNAFGLNTIQLNFQYKADKFRAFGALHFGDYAKTSWSTQFNNIMEGNAGLRVFKKLWIDVGFFRTHIGTEGLLPRENICSSSSISTYYEPAFASGVRFNYLPSDKWFLNLYILNAYNGFDDLNDKKSFGVLFNYSINKSITLGYSNYLGEDTPSSIDTNSQIRFYQNIYLNANTNSLKFQIGGDYCIQQNSKISQPNKVGVLFSGVATASLAFTKRSSIYSRFEWFHDPNGILSPKIIDFKGNQGGYKLWGLTTGIEFKPMDNLFIRLEGRQLNMDSNQQLFYWKTKNKNSRQEIMLNTGFSF